MKTRKNVKGFTLVELIVVIAIIGVLAAILVPSMLGYVKKANVSAANSNAKTLYNAGVSALTDLDANGTPFKAGDSGTEVNCLNGDAEADMPDDGNAVDTDVANRVKKYFDAVDDLTVADIWVTDVGVCTASRVQKGNYYGAYPKATTEDDCTTAPTLPPAED